MSIRDKHIKIGFDNVVGGWYIEAFGLRQWLALEYLPYEDDGKKDRKPLRRVDFVDAGKRARIVLEQRLIKKGIFYG